MARNRQRAKERQAARRAARGEGVTAQPAPPEDLGHGDDVLEPEPDVVDEAADRELELEAEEAGAFSDEPVEEVAPQTATGPRGVRGVEAGAAGEERRGLGKVWHFFENVWAEL
jgi:hypothetical protein